MDNWNEIKTAFVVIKHGTISGAAQELGVHRATVLRHVDALEQELGTKLFIRHASGYLPTEIGKELLQVAKVTQEQFQQFSRRAKSITGELEGEFVISALDIAFPLIQPAIKLFQARHPKVIVNYQSSPDIFKLEYGQAHIAIRSGMKPTENDYVCRPFFDVDAGLYAHKQYIATYGQPNNLTQLGAHRFIGTDDLNAKPVMHQWMRDNIPSAQITIRSSSRVIQKQALESGLGIGIMLAHEASTNSELVAVLTDHTWTVNNWIVTHGDLHRSEKIQAFLSILKDQEYLSQVNVMLSKPQ